MPHESHGKSHQDYRYASNATGIVNLQPSLPQLQYQPYPLPSSIVSTGNASQAFSRPVDTGGSNSMDRDVSSYPEPSTAPNTISAGALSEGYACDICGKVLSTLATLERHKRMHGDPLWVCPREDCSHRGAGKGFRTTEVFRTHYLTHSPSYMEMYSITRTSLEDLKRRYPWQPLS